MGGWALKSCRRRLIWGWTLVLLGAFLLGFAGWQSYRVVDPLLKQGWGRVLREAYSLQAFFGDQKAARLRARVERDFWPYLTAKLNLFFLLGGGGFLLTLLGVGMLRRPPSYCVRWGRLPREYRRREGFVVGRVPGFLGPLVRLPPATHAIMLAPSGVGKTSTLIHGLLTWPGGAIVTDPKGEIFEHTAEFRSRALKQDILYWSFDAPAHPMPLGKLYGDNIAALEELRNLYVKRTGTDPAFLNPWVDTLKALIRDAEHRGEPAWQAALAVPMGLWVSALKEIAEEPHNPAREDALTALEVLQRGERYVASVEGTVSGLHGLLRRIAPALDAPRAAIDFRNATIYLALQEGADDERILAVWALDGLYKAFKRAGLSSDPYGVLWVIDEAGVLRPSLLPDMIRIGRGRGAGVVAIAQSWADLAQAYGTNAANSLLGALNGPVAILGVHQGDPATKEYLTKVLSPFVYVSRRAKGDQPIPSPYQAAQDLLSQMRSGVLIPPRSAPVPLEPAPWFRDRRVARMVRRAEPPEIIPPASVRARPLGKTGATKRGEDDLDLGDL